MKQQRSQTEKCLRTRWRSMHRRCKSGPGNYEKFGVSVCEEWQGESGFENFKNWAIENGFSSELVIDRIDTYGNYSPENCRWVTQKQNNCNKTDTVYVYDGDKKVSLSEYCEIYGLNHSQRQRIYRGIYRERKQRFSEVDKLIYENVKRLCAERNITVMELEKACGIANGTVGKWALRNSSPRVETLLRVASYFDVSMDELVRKEV